MSTAEGVVTRCPENCGSTRINWGDVLKFDIVGALMGPVVAATSVHKTVGICGNVAGGFGAGGVASACAGISGKGTPFTSETLGGGAGSPTISGGVTLMFSSGASATDMAKYFKYVGGSAGLGLGGSLEFETGKDSSGQTVNVESGGLSFGAPRVEVHFGRSYTWVQNG